MGTTASQIKGPPSVDPFNRDTVTTLKGQTVRPDTEVTVTGMGRCRFRALVTNPDNGATWVDLIDARGRYRAARPELVRVVHRSVKLRSPG